VNGYITALIILLVGLMSATVGLVLIRNVVHISEAWDREAAARKMAEDKEREARRQKGEADRRLEEAHSKLNAIEDGYIPSHLEFLAIAQHQHGKNREAKATLGRLREVMKQPRWAKDTEAAGFLREAEELIEGKAAGKAK
jgi:hypothetical protein